MLTEMSGKWTTLHSYSIYDQSPFSNLKVTLADYMQNLYPLAGHNTAGCKFTLFLFFCFFHETAFIFCFRTKFKEASRYIYYSASIMDKHDTKLRYRYISH